MINDKFIHTDIYIYIYMKYKIKKKQTKITTTISNTSKLLIKSNLKRKKTNYK